MADRTNITLERPEETAEATAPAPASGGGIKAFLPLIITVVLMPVLAWATTSFVLVPKLQKSLGLAAMETEAAQAESAPAESTSAKGKGKDSGTKETVVMSKLLVNVSGTMGSRYLLASVTLAGSGPDFKTKMEKNEAKLRDMACTALATKTINDLEKPGARNLVRTELLTGFNNILGANTVQEIYITEFAIQ
jgi:flagellar protein FliL